MAAAMPVLPRHARASSSMRRGACARTAPAGRLHSTQVRGVQARVPLSQLPQVLHAQLQQPEQLHVVVGLCGHLGIDRALLQRLDEDGQRGRVLQPDLQPNQHARAAIMP
jgi:hypothetical protein